MSQIHADGVPPGCTPADLKRWDDAVAESKGKFKSREAAAAAESKPPKRSTAAAPPPAETDKPDTGKG